MDPAGDEARLVAERVARDSYGRLLAFLAARSRDIAGAEDALADAFASALEQWPRGGIPRSPEAWLIAIARRRLVDQARRARTRTAAAPELMRAVEEAQARLDGQAEIPDDRLALMFACAHPAIDTAARTPLILQTVLGFTAARIASAFLSAPAAMGQRLVRAKRKIGEAGVPFRLPDATDLPARLETVLDAVYATFADGWTPPGSRLADGSGLADEAIWLGRLTANLMPDQPEALGLLALMLHVQARAPARRTADGRYVPLAEQDPGAWDQRQIDEAERLLARAAAARRPGRYQLEAAIQSAHAIRRLTGRTDWAAVLGLYDQLLALTASPVVAINRAIALAEHAGAAAGLAALDALAADPRLADYQPYWAAQAELAARTGDSGRADAAYQRAIGLATDPAVREFLETRRAHLGAPKSSSSP